MKRILVATALLVSVLAIGGAASAVEPPESCTFDPAMGGSGVAVTPALADGYELDRMDLDSLGRLYTTNYQIVDDSYVVDRVRRFLPDGSVDGSFGTNGYVDLPGQVFNNTGRLVAVDDLGRIWIARNTYTNVKEVHRLTADGAIDASFPPIELEVGVNMVFDPVGAMAGDGSGVVLGHGVNASGSFAMMHLVRIAGDGAVTEAFSFALGGSSVFISAVDPTGWMAGNTRDANSIARPILWDGDPINGLPQDSYRPSNVRGAFSEVVVRDGMVQALGFEVLNDDFDLLAMTLDFPTGGSLPSYFGPSNPEAGDALVRSSFDGTPMALFADGTVVGLTGPTGGDLFVGSKNSAGVIEIDTVQPDLTSGAYPAPSIVIGSGTQVVGGFGDFATDQAFIVGLTPELGPDASPDALADQIGRLYQAYYLRPADPGGLAFWSEQRASGRSLDDISAQFAGAPEFADLYGDLSDAAFVDLIYTNVLGRAGDAGGRAFWTGELTSGARTRGSVMLEFSESSENLDRTSTVAPHDAATGAVYRLYRAYFERGPDAGGSCFWVRRLAGGATLNDVSNAFAVSDEFVSIYGALDNREFVELIYQNVLGRAGEASGVDFWAGELDSGRRSRGQVMVGFSESPEHVERTGTLPS